MRKHARRILGSLVAFTLPVILILLISGRSSYSFDAIEWQQAAPALAPRAETMSATIGNKLYVLGGFDPSIVPTNDVSVYDPVLDSWTSLAPLPVTLTHSGTAIDTVENRIYLAGGYQGKPEGGQIFAIANVFCYDIATNTWSELPPLPQPRGSGGLVNLNQELHFFSGADLNRFDRNEHWVLNLNAPELGWQASAPVKYARSHLGTLALNGKIYAIGGQTCFDECLITQPYVETFDPSLGIWEDVAPLPQARSHIGAATFVVNDRIIVLGGEIAHTQSVNNVTQYDLISNSWTELTPLPEKLNSGAAGAVDGNIYYVSGAPVFRTTTYKGTPLLVAPPSS